MLMTVAKLIEELKKLEQNGEVNVCEEGGQYSSSFEIEVSTYSDFEGNKVYNYYLIQDED